jgi:hypothetical protein
MPVSKGKKEINRRWTQINANLSEPLVPEPLYSASNLRPFAFICG